MTVQTASAPAMLSGIRILDLTSVVFGPYCTQILADLGADVIKVETPNGGDTYRWATKSASTPGMSPGFMAINRGKCSIALDLKQADDLAAVHALLADADVFILNIRGKAAERLGLDYVSVQALRPDVIYVHCVGFGQDGLTPICKPMTTSSRPRPAPRPCCHASMAIRAPATCLR